MTTAAADRTPAEPAARARFQFFVVLWALAALLYHRWHWFPSDFRSLPMVAAALVIAKPSSHPRFLAFVALQTLFAYRDLPEANTNRTLMVFLGASILGAWPVASWRARGLPGAAQWLRCFEPALRAQLLLVYAWACWHKLNLDFFDTSKSCGVELYLKVASRVPFLPWPTGPAALSAAVAGTILAEGLLPILLLLRRTRIAGVALGMALHFGFGLTMFYDFSMTMMALLFLFAPPELARRMLEDPRLSLRAWLQLSPRAWSLAAPIALLAFILVTRAVFWDMYDVFALAWWSLLVAFAVCGWALVGRRWSQPWTRELLRMPPVLAIFPLAVFLNGLCPYVGSKTETAFAMYSNLRTEGGRTNHLIVRRPLAWFDYQTDLAVVESSSDAELSRIAADGHPVPFFVLRKRVAELIEESESGIAITYERADRRRVVAQAELDPELADPPSYFERKLLRFRTILPAEANVCSH
jgi:hypothetical protein